MRVISTNLHSLTARKLKLIGLIIFIAYVIISFFTLAKVPRVFVDEATYTENAWTFVKEGHFGNKMFTSLYGLEKSNVAYGRLYLLAEAASFKLFGLGPFQARLPQFIFGLLSLLVLYKLTKILFDEKIALWTTLGFAVSVPFLRHSHEARPEMMLTFFILFSFYLLLIAEKNLSATLYFLSGLVSAFAADIHLNGIIVPAALAVVLAYRSGIKIFLKKEGIAFLSRGFSGTYLVVLSSYLA